MKNISNLFLSILLIIISFQVFAAEPVNDTLYITQHWFSYTTSYDIKAENRKVGSLYRNAFTIPLSYSFYDPNDNLRATAWSQFFSFNVHFDIFDTSDAFLGAVDEELFAFFPTFDVYGYDGVSTLATAKMNFWGTTFYIYDPISHKEMATLTRPFFRFKNDWTFKVTNLKLFASKNINPKVLMTVIAFQGDREYWEKQDSYKIKANQSPNFFSSDLLNQLENTKVLLGIESVATPNQIIAEKTSTLLDENYKKIMLDHSNKISNQEQVNEYIKSALDLINSNSLSQEEKETAVFLLENRLTSKN